MHPLRRALDGLYALSLALAALAVASMAGVIALQVGARALDRALEAFGLPGTGFNVPSLAEFGGFVMVAASFLAAGPALRKGAHVRVKTLLSNVPPKVGHVLELLSLGLGALLLAYATYHAGALVLDSYRFNEVSYGIVPVPLMYPQALMAFGLAVMTVALLDDLASVALGGQPSYAAAEAEGLAAEGE